MVVKMSRRGTITLPVDVRRGLSEDVHFDIVRRDDGVIELHPKIMIDASQAWYWTERWQKMEREADEAYARGDFREFQTGEQFLEELEARDEELRREGR